jgi:predicted transcriptional regulator
MEKTFVVSKKGRIFKKGYHLQDTDVAAIQYWLHNGLTVDEVASKLQLDKRTVKKYETNTLVNRGGRSKKWNQEVFEYFTEILKQDPTLFLSEIQQKLVDDLNLQRDVSVICRWLKNYNFTRKKVEKIAFYRSTARIQNLRANFR